MNIIVSTSVCFLLQNCQLEQDNNIPSTVSTTPTIQPPPPLNPISTQMNVTTTTTTTTTTTPSTNNTKLPRIPPISDETDVKQHHHRLMNTPSTLNSNESMKGLVGGVTTWFPPSSTIQVGNNQLMKPPQFGPVHVPRPQFVEILGDKKYLIIPKHNVLSVSPSPSKSEENVKIAQNEPDAPNPASLGPYGKKRRESTSPVFHGFPREEVRCYAKFGRLDDVINSETGCNE